MLHMLKNMSRAVMYAIFVSHLGRNEVKYHSQDDPNYPCVDSVYVSNFQQLSNIVSNSGSRAIV